MITRIHANRHVSPPLTAEDGTRAADGNEAVLLGPEGTVVAKVMYQDETLWLETELSVVMK